MAYDKVVDSAQLDAGLAEIADAVRAKGGTSSLLTFPDGFASAVSAIQSGETDLANVDVYVPDFTSSEELIVLAGALDKYARVVAS